VIPVAGGVASPSAIVASAGVANGRSHHSEMVTTRAANRGMRVPRWAETPYGPTLLKPDGSHDVTSPARECPGFSGGAHDPSHGRGLRRLTGGYKFASRNS
jgi:hypothetical protein